MKRVIPIEYIFPAENINASNKCKFCKRFSIYCKGGWCPCCFSLWYDGGPEFRYVERLVEVSLRNSPDTFAPEINPTSEKYDEDFEELSNYFGE